MGNAADEKRADALVGLSLAESREKALAIVTYLRGMDANRGLSEAFDASIERAAEMFGLDRELLRAAALTRLRAHSFEVHGTGGDKVAHVVLEVRVTAPATRREA